MIEFHLPMMINTAPETADLELISARDPALLTRLFEETNPLLFRLLAGQRVYAESAEDLVNQTWERFFTNLEKFERRSTLRTFICGILSNKIREHRRATGRFVLEEDSEDVLDRAFTPEGWWKSPPPDPSALIYSNQLSNFIEGCLEGLSENQRAAFMMKEVEQEDSTLICNVLALSPSNLRVLIFRSKEKLKLCLEGKLGEGGKK